MGSQSTVHPIIHSPDISKGWIAKRRNASLMIWSLVMEEDLQRLRCHTSDRGRSPQSTDYPEQFHHQSLARCQTCRLAAHRYGRVQMRLWEYHAATLVQRPLSTPTLTQERHRSSSYTLVLLPTFHRICGRTINPTNSSHLIPTSSSPFRARINHNTLWLIQHYALHPLQLNNSNMRRHKQICNSNNSNNTFHNSSNNSQLCRNNITINSSISNPYTPHHFRTMGCNRSSSERTWFHRHNTRIRRRGHNCRKWKRNGERRNKIAGASTLDRRVLDLSFRPPLMWVIGSSSLESRMETWQHYMEVASSRRIGTDLFSELDCAVEDGFDSDTSRVVSVDSSGCLAVDRSH